MICETNNHTDKVSFIGSMFRLSDDLGWFSIIVVEFSVIFFHIAILLFIIFSLSSFFIGLNGVGAVGIFSLLATVFIWSLYAFGGVIYNLVVGGDFEVMRLLFSLPVVGYILLQFLCVASAKQTNRMSKD